MAILPQHIHILSMEQRENRIIKGNVLTIGQQSVWQNIEQTRKILNKYNLKNYPINDSSDFKNNIKSWTNKKKIKNISCKALLKIMGADKVEALDISDYEEADIIHNQNEPIDNLFFSKYDLVLDQGSLEHIFDVPTALQNLSNMVKVGGTLGIAVPASNFIDHGFYSFSPTLFIDFFDANNFTDTRVYLREGSPRIYNRKGRLFKYNFSSKEKPIVSSKSIEVIVFAKKGAELINNCSIKPIQSIYNPKKNFNTAYKNNIKINNISSLRKKAIFLLRNRILDLLKFMPYEIERISFNMIRRFKYLKYIGRY